MIVPKNSAQGRAGGRPPQTWWDDMWCDIWGLILPGRPQAREPGGCRAGDADLGGAQHGTPLAEATARPKARKLFKALQGRGYKLPRLRVCSLFQPFPSDIRVQASPSFALYPLASAGGLTENWTMEPLAVSINDTAKMLGRRPDVDLRDDQGRPAGGLQARPPHAGEGGIRSAGWWTGRTERAMPARRRVNPNVIKIHRSYSVGDLADRLGVHKNTVRNWQRNGLVPIDDGRPVLFQGAVVRDFLKARNASSQAPLPGRARFYCFRCREPRPPAGGHGRLPPGHGAVSGTCARSARAAARSCTAGRR